MAGITAQSPAKGLGAFAPGLDPGEECAKGGVRLRGPSPWSGEGPEGQAGRSAWLRQRNAKDPKGKPSVPSGFASGTRKRSPSPFRRQSLSPCATCAAEGRTIRSRNLGDKAFRIHHGERGEHGEKREAASEHRPHPPVARAPPPASPQGRSRKSECPAITLPNSLGAGTSAAHQARNAPSSATLGKASRTSMSRICMRPHFRV